MTRAVERAAREWSGTGGREPLEVVHAIVDAVVERIEPAARGRYVFPFNRIQVSIAAPTKELRARFAAVLESEPALRTRIATRLQDARCDTGTLDLAVTYVAQPGAAWLSSEFHVDFARLPRPRPPAAHAGRDLGISILRGTAEQPEYAFTLPRINLGRCAEVRDRLSRLVRTNHVAFNDSSEAANDTVSRCHAHIEFVEGVRQYRIRDDRSAYGTSILRNGRTLSVPAGSRGIRLESGDEIMLGEARARIRIGGD